jgi:hypothetical protein
VRSARATPFAAASGNDARGAADDILNPRPEQGADEREESV